MAADDRIASLKVYHPLHLEYFRGPYWGSRIWIWVNPPFELIDRFIQLSEMTQHPIRGDRTTQKALEILARIWQRSPKGVEWKPQEIAQQWDLWGPDFAEFSLRQTFDQIYIFAYYRTNQVKRKAIWESGQMSN